ncbi:MAG: SMP-30/gluconolactonase/LRE family protein, partial [Caldilineaceae bacterium]|nr:SMP-30/gluconolactonase/LRE family protein [Caldilineaceae bacterium]
FAATGPIAVDLHGFVFMIDGNVVHRFYPDGTYCQTIPEPSSAITLNGPKGLAVDQFRNLFVADSGNDQILIFQPQWLDGRSGRYQHVQTVAGHGLDEPRGMAVVPNRVVEGAELLAVVDGNNDRVQVFTIAITGSDTTLAQRAQTNDTITLTHLVNFGSTGNNPGEFTDPVDVAADRARRLFVVDRALHRVSRWTLNPAGTAYSHDVDWEKAGGGSGSGNREFDTPEAIAVDWKNHYAYVAEAGNHRVQRLDADSGNHLVHWGDPHAPALANPYVPIGVAVDSRGEIYVADRDNIRVVRGTTYNAAGADQGVNTAPTGVGSAWTPHTEPAHMVEPAYTLFTPDGRLWVSDTGNNRVLLYARNAAKELTLVTPIPALAGLDRPTGLAVDVNGDLYVVDRGNDRVRRYDSTFAHQADFGSTGSGANEFDNPRGAVLIQRTEKRLYVADRDNDRVQVIKLDDGSFLPQIDRGDPAKPGGGTSFDKPEDVAVDSKGNLYIADTGNRRIVQFDANDGYVREIKLTDPALRFQEPCGLAVDRDDKLLVTDRGLHTVFLIEADGDIVAFWDLKALARMRTLAATKAPKKGDVTFAGGLTVKPYTEIYSKEAQIVTKAGVLTFTPKDGSAPTPHNLNVGDLVFAKAGKRVGEDDLLFARLVETEYFPELSRHLKFDGPSRAVIDERGLLAVDDTNNHRVRLVRTATTLKLNLLDLGEQLPDISFRAVTEADWREALGLEVKIAKVPLDGAAIVLRNIPVLRVFLGGLSTMSFARNDFITEPEKNFSDDQYREDYQLGNRNLVSAAINTLKVMYTVQRWLHHLSREDEADHRWGNPARKRTLKVDLLRKPGSYHAWFAENINLGSDETGRGGDSWD